MQIERTVTINLVNSHEVELFTGLINIAREELLHRIRHKEMGIVDCGGFNSVGMSGLCSDQEIHDAYEFAGKLEI